MSLWLLTAGLLVVTVVAFVWAKASSGGGRRAEAGENVILDAPQQQPMRKQAKGEAQVQDAAPGYARAPAPPSHPSASRPRAGAAVRSSSPNTLAWATFAVSAFGTLSSFVFSLLTYLRTG
jgi:hypothetical protein